ncbi:acyl-CoA carboxylase subunit epsilon [Streptomyces cyaneofuscatus]|uniref:acyl-CoA carboxylase subunit epsilon n=1 Tax=Streptomyces cyaneofuscatus TaxID=66883 RepID=UPI003F4B2F59
MSLTSAESVLRVEKGHAAPEELAAITAVLMARAAAQPSAPAHRGLGIRRPAPPRRSTGRRCRTACGRAGPPASWCATARAGC